MTFVPYVLGFIALSMSAVVLFLILQPKWLIGRIIGSVLAFLIGILAQRLTSDLRPEWLRWVLFIPSFIGVCTALFYPRKG